MLAKKFLLSVAVFGTLGMASLASSSSAATIINVGTFPPANPYFYLTSGAPTDPTITANFGATISAPSVSFDDIFEFTIPQNGLGSGSLSTSFSSPRNLLVITDVVINGTAHTVTNLSGGQSFSIDNIPIMNGVLNTFEIIGTTGSQNVAATYTGTATFEAAVIPEPASWALMIGGLGLVGATMRRQRNGLQFA